MRFLEIAGPFQVAASTQVIPKDGQTSQRCFGSTTFVFDSILVSLDYLVQSTRQIITFLQVLLEVLLSGYLSLLSCDCTDGDGFPRILLHVDLIHEVIEEFSRRWREDLLYFALTTHFGSKFTMLSRLFHKAFGVLVCRLLRLDLC